MKKYLLEILLGAGAAGLVLGLLAGLDLTPLLIGAAFAALIKLVVDGRAPLGRRFEQWAIGGAPVPAADHLADVGDKRRLSGNSWAWLLKRQPQQKHRH